ncbi:hypothetical protein BE04_17595 [Sorangium cellulosum]|uniref:Uncharacterized protein n=2 Tax=Sorangium cellulosum TaxID=56 RepID=A0A150PBM6_SORCE|nr:hypothetical protein [Sorangium cellulosum]AGP37795.1 hypothetical protein SCE1572_26950 [Sorangium cellulosum So0157-2]KYF53056.1 hypothetical protein BE04_17595 [Sorangium cellulosum]
MMLSGRKIRHLSTVTHDGKVVFFGTAADGIMPSYGTNLDHARSTETPARGSAPEAPRPQ